MLERLAKEFPQLLRSITHKLTVNVVDAKSPKGNEVLKKIEAVNKVTSSSTGLFSHSAKKRNESSTIPDVEEAAKHTRALAM